MTDSHPELPSDPDLTAPGVNITPTTVAVVVVGGALGSIARYGIKEALTPQHGWPVATLLVNVVGAFLLGLLLEGLARRGPDVGSRQLSRLALGTGVLGGFTTYSTMAEETVNLGRAHDWGTAVGYPLVTVTIGLLAAALGVWVAARSRSS